MNLIDPSIFQGFVPWSLDLGGWHGDSPIFDELIEQIRPGLIIEVGTWKGQSAIHMGECLLRLSIPGRIICVDTWLGSSEFWGELSHTPDRDLHLRHGYPHVYFQFLSNVIHRRLEGVILPFPNTAKIASRVLQDRGIQADLVYVDASHEEEDVYDDIVSYWEILRPGGTIFGDDLNWASSRGSVISAVRRFCAEKEIQFTTRYDCFWIIEKPSQSK